MTTTESTAADLLKYTIWSRFTRSPRGHEHACRISEVRLTGRITTEIIVAGSLSLESDEVQERFMDFLDFLDSALPGGDQPFGAKGCEDLVSRRLSLSQKQCWMLSASSGPDNRDLLLPRLVLQLTRIDERPDDRPKRCVYPWAAPLFRRLGDDWRWRWNSDRRWRRIRPPGCRARHPFLLGCAGPWFRDSDSIKEKAGSLQGRLAPIDNCRVFCIPWKKMRRYRRRALFE
jgi:hypothetical protein